MVSGCGLGSHVTGGGRSSWVTDGGGDGWWVEMVGSRENRSVRITGRSPLELPFAMAPRLVPASTNKPMTVRSHVSRPKAICKARMGMAKLNTIQPETTACPGTFKAKRRGTVFAKFCKSFFAEKGGGHGQLQAAARAWNMLTPKQKATHTDAGRLEKDANQPHQERDDAPPTVARSSGATDCSGLSLPRSHDIRMGEYTVVQGQRAIGAGSYGQALEVEHRSGRRMAMKLFHDADQCLSELTAYRAIARATKDALVHEAACPFLSLYDMCTVPPLMWITMPLVAGGNLWTQMKSRAFGRGEVATIMYDAWLALQFLHQKAGVLHLDVKPQNMMWTGERLLIIDFSLWERWPVPATCALQRTYCTAGFRPPEMDHTKPMSRTHLHRVFRPAVDWWSLGCSGAYSTHFGCVQRPGEMDGARPPSV